MIFRPLSTQPTIILVSEKMLNWIKNVISIKKLPIIKAEIFLKSNFELNQILLTGLAQNSYIWNFQAFDLFHICIKDQKNALELKKKLKVC